MSLGGGNMVQRTEKYQGQGLSLFVRFALLLGLTSLLLSGCGSTPATGMRIATMNGQFRVAPATTSECCRYMGDSRVALLAAEIRDSQYDVIAMQEIFDDAAQDGLSDKLRRNYPHIIRFVDGDADRRDVDDLEDMQRYLDGDLVVGSGFPAIICAFFGDSCQDSGLMLLSKFPFEPLPPGISAMPADQLKAESAGASWGGVAFLEFSECTGFDCQANKGVALVRIKHPGGQIYNVFWAHLQAGNSELEKLVRIAQLRQVRQFIEGSLTSAKRQTEHVFFLGDLNVNGQSNSLTRDEWDTTFGPVATTARGFFSQELSDQYESMVDIAGIPIIDRDPGLTSGSTRERTRLDYILHNTPNGPALNEPLCAQHVAKTYDLYRDSIGREAAFGTAGLRPLSDHVGVAIDLNFPFHACRPSTAEVLFRSTSVREIRDDPSKFILSQAGSVQWFRIDSPGTYSISVLPTSAGLVGFQVFRVNNMSIEHLPYGYVGTSEAIPQTGGRFDIEEGGFFVKVYSPDLSTASYRLDVKRHQCSSPTDSCMLYPNRNPAQSFQFPLPTVGSPNELWFDIHTETSFSGAPQTIDFFANQIGSSALLVDHDFVLFDALGTSLASIAAGTPASLTRIGEDERVYRRLLVRRADPTSSRFIDVGWDTDLLILKLGALTAVEETDDVGGGDEDDNVRMNLWMESTYVFRNGSRIALGAFKEDDFKPLPTYMACPIGYLSRPTVAFTTGIILEEDDPLENDWLRGVADNRIGGREIRLIEAEDSGAPARAGNPTTPSGNGFSLMENDTEYRLSFDILRTTNNLRRPTGTRINGWIYCPLKSAEADTDGDGIEDDVDLNDNPSESFSDTINGLHGKTLGAILNRGDRTWRIIDEPNIAATIPNDGVRITVGPGRLEGVVQGLTGSCSPSIRLAIPPSSTTTEIVFSCGSINVQVDRGFVELKDNGRNIYLHAGQARTFKKH